MEDGMEKAAGVVGKQHASLIDRKVWVPVDLPRNEATLNIFK